MSGTRQFVAILALALAAGCGQIRAQTCENAVAAAYFLSGGFEGSVIVSRTLGRNGLRLDARNLRLPNTVPTFSLVIHELPTFVGTSEFSCSSVGPVYNPTNAQAGMELGNLTGLSPFSGPAVMSVTSSLTMVGDNGIIGRPLGILTTSGELVACANLEYISSNASGTLKPCSRPNDANHQETFMARFNTIVGGTVVMRQLSSSSASGPYVTTVYSHLYSTSGADTSTGHIWHLYSGTPSSCDGLATVISNLSASVASRPTISSQPSGYTGKRFTSICLPESLTQLTSSGSVSVAVGAASASFPNATGIRACAGLYRLPQRTVQATFTSGAATGWAVVSQGSPFTPPVLVQNFSSGTLNVIVNTLPVQKDGQCPSTGGVFNPFTSSYPAGSIGGKLGNSPQAEACTGSATLRGLHSLAGRSVSIGTGNQKQCQNLVEQLESGDTVVRARAEFTGSVSGTIYLEQVRYSSGLLGETTIHSTGLTADAMSLLHNMHVHVGRIGWQTNANACGAGFAGGHYDPYGVAANSTLYSQQCESRYPHRCEVGDTSRKTGQFNLNGASFVRHDVNLPLSGANTVIGRSFVIHEENGGAPRLACANIVPFGAVTFQLQFPLSGLQGGAIDHSDFLQRLMAVLLANGNGATVSYLQSFNTTTTGYFRGVIGGGVAVSRAARTLALSEDLGPYTDVPEPSSAALATSSVALLLISGLLSVLL